MTDQERSRQSGEVSGKRDPPAPRIEIPSYSQVHSSAANATTAASGLGSRPAAGSLGPPPPWSGNLLALGDAPPRASAGRAPPAPPAPAPSTALQPARAQGPQTQLLTPSNPGHTPPNPNAVLVNRRQEGNPVLKHLKNVRWQFADILPDYEAGPSTGVLFLSLRFHLLKPAYIFGRMRATARAYRLVVLLCHVDTEAAAEPLNDVARAALGNECTLLCAWSPQECASYLELLKLHEPRAGEAGPRAARKDAAASLQAALTSVRGVTKADVKTLGDRFGTLARLFEATEKELEECPGIGPTKVRRLVEAFREPFYRTGAGAALPSSQAAAGPSEPAPRGADAGGAGAEGGATGPLVEDDVDGGSDSE